ncbi:16S rRNA (uracil(1498)-N(3))-methyltransferase [Cognatiluteimonas profundi]|uniref:16S rRNA (uracil(1498)-N(3))-methyltransferase n=1 Tax=Cognatiluteimonas profundi TaxID=2594501 RepID=UPI00131AD4A1|nr:16S rRNA (uracil(1498)-N(3))-methyltransferase [Lysobacter profundi]
MRLTRVHVDAHLAVGRVVTLPESAATHLARVLRLKAGDPCLLFNGDGNDYAARITVLGKREVIAQVDSSCEVDNESPLAITLVQGIARGDKMDWILQKSTELGVNAFVPTSSERSEVRLEGDRADKRLAHWRSVVIAACEQSGRARIPTMTAVHPLQRSLSDLQVETRFLLDPQASGSIADLDAPGGGACVLAVGPEGGWSPRDRAMLEAAGFTGLRLGPRVLRTETAGIAAIAALQAGFGDLGQAKPA